MKFALCAGALAAAVASVASADTTLNLGNNALLGGAYNEYSFSLDGTLTSFKVDFDYVGGGGGSWSSDMLLLVIDPNGVGKFWGGFNVNPAGFTDAGIWAFDGSGSAADGHYTDTKAVAGLSGTGTWTFRVYNGWTTAPLNNYNNFTVNAVGLVPAPGAVALLGLAGLVGRRRRA
jgi:MYXO-CTERM domain-containing protein